MKKTFLFIGLGLLMLAGCKKSGPKQLKQPPAKHTEQDKKGKMETKDKKSNALTTEAKRKDLVHRELSECELTVIRHDGKGMTPKERSMVKELLAAGNLIETVNKLMINPKNLEYEKAVQNKATADDKELFRRNQQPWCVDIEDPLCCAMNPCPKKEIGAYLWPENFTDQDFAAITKAKNKAALLSPFTIVRRDKNGFKAIPYAEAPLFKPYLQKIANHMRNAAQYCDEPTLKKFLLSRAKAFETADPFPYDDSDYDWIGLKGDWDLTIGPYEVYKNPRQVKARFEFVLGKVDPQVTEQLNKFRSRLQEMESYLADLVGHEIYKGRKLNPGIAIRAINVWMAAGDGRNPQGVVAAFHLPNRGKSVDEGLYKKVMLVNHMRAFSTVMKRRAELILDPQQLKYVDSDADIYNTTFHEFSHGFGAHDELKIKTKSGAVMTVHEALKELSSLLEEEKADVFSLYFVPVFVKKGWITQEDAKKRYVSALMHLIGLMQYNLKGTYPRMVSVQLGWYLDHGAVTFDRKTGRLHVNFEKMPDAVKSLAKRVATIQLTGDHADGVKLVGKYVIKKGDTFTLAEPLKQIRDLSKSRFAKAGIKTLSMKYEVHEL